jgi:seryl-tRNA synthetase
VLTDTLREVRQKIVLDQSHDEVAQQWDDVLSTFPHPRNELVPTGVVHDGDAEVRRYYQDTRTAFPDQRHEMIQLRAQRRRRHRRVLPARHAQGPVRSDAGDRQRVQGADDAFFVFEGETLVCERISFDVLTMLKQLIAGLNFAPGPSAIYCCSRRSAA